MLFPINWSNLKDFLKFLHEVEGGSKGIWTPPQNSRGGPGPPDPPWSEAHATTVFVIVIIKEIEHDPTQSFAYQGLC